MAVHFLITEGTVFVGAFETPEHVYFFFRETAEEFRTDEKTLVSRVARVCKVSLQQQPNILIFLYISKHTMTGTRYIGLIHQKPYKVMYHM